MRRPTGTMSETIPMRVASLAVDPLTTLPVVILEDDAGVATVCIRVGAGDASAIAAELDRIELVRPMTHQLMGDILAGAGVRVVSVVIDEVEEGSFFGVLHFELPSGERLTKEARSSDALALALHADAELRVARVVVERASHGAIPRAARADTTALARRAAFDVSPAVEDRPGAREVAGDKLRGKWKM